MGKGDRIALLHALSGAGAMVVGLLTKGGLGGSPHLFKQVGLGVSGVGMLLFAYTVAFLRAAFLGNVEPVTEHLIRDGPYRRVRHPLYVSMLITILGFSLALRSIAGLAVAVAIFLPLTVLRARLEEASLRAKFGAEWEAYAAKTHFLLPLVF